jgi:hypothetical protein
MEYDPHYLLVFQFIFLKTKFDRVTSWLLIFSDVEDTN